MTRILIAGLARSGTSMLFSNLQTIVQQENKYRFVYEPYLWSPEVFDSDYSEYGNAFNVTDSLHVDGIYVHCKTPLFLEGSHPIHDKFLSEKIFPKEVARSLCKIIRGNGRVESYLDLFPDLRVIVIVRNPMDSINSIMGAFTYFGDEFHPSDKKRLLEELKTKSQTHFDFDKNDEVAWSLLWWRSMSDAAMNAARKHPDRVLALSYESYTSDKQSVLEKTCSFLGFDYFPLTDEEFGRHIGMRTKTVNLTFEDVRQIESHSDHYWNEIVPHCLAPKGFEPIWAKNKIEARYRSNEGASILRKYPTNRTAIRWRKTVAESENQECSASQQLEGSDRIAAVRVLNNITRSCLLKFFGPIGRRLRRETRNLHEVLNVSSDPADVTCIVTTYNNARTLCRAVLSILAQTRPVKTIVIADDCSTDGSRDLIQSLASEFSSVSCIFRDQNIGPGLNRHFAIESAETEFVTTLDGDDFYAAEKNEAEFNALKQDMRFGVAYSDTYLIPHDSSSFCQSTQEFEGLTNKADRIKALLMRRVAIPRDMLFSKHLYSQSGGYDKSAAMYEDWAFKLRLADSSVRWCHSGKIGTNYVRHGYGLSSANTIYHAYWQFYVVAKNWVWIKKYVDENLMSRVMERIGSIVPGKMRSASVLVGLSHELQFQSVRSPDLDIIFTHFMRHAPLNPTVEDIDQKFTELRQTVADTTS